MIYNVKRGNGEIFSVNGTTLGGIEMIVWKFPITMQKKQRIAMPAGANPISVGMQDNQVVLWATIPDEKAQVEPVDIVVIGTGWLHEEVGDHLGTVQLKNGLVFHVFMG